MLTLDQFKYILTQFIQRNNRSPNVCFVGTIALKDLKINPEFNNYYDKNSNVPNYLKDIIGANVYCGCILGMHVVSGGSIVSGNYVEMAYDNNVSIATARHTKESKKQMQDFDPLSSHEPDLGPFYWVKTKDTDRDPEIMRLTTCSDGSKMWLACGDDRWAFDGVEVLSPELVYIKNKE